MLRLAAVLILVTPPSQAAGEHDVSAEERASYRALLLGRLPPSPGNRYADNAKAAKLGQQFFFDTRFSGPLAVDSDLGKAGESGKVACATCHDPARGGTDHRSKPGNTSLGAGFTGRNAPTVFNAAYSPWMFWDGRKDSVWSQALGPVESPVEHNFTRLEVAHLIRTHYRKPYQAVFGKMPDISRLPPRGKPGDAEFDALDESDKRKVNTIFANFGKAIEAYERKLVSSNSAFDRFARGDKKALSPSAQLGAKLFFGKAKCSVCHSGPNFTDGQFHNLGVPQQGPNLPASDRGRFAGIPQVTGDEFNGAGSYSDAQLIKQLDKLAPASRDDGAFRTPGLRGIAQTAPYMHTGTLNTLRDVVVFYNAGGGNAGFVGQKDPLMTPLGLTPEEIDALVEFMKALDGAPLPAALVKAPALPR